MADRQTTTEPATPDSTAAADGGEVRAEAATSASASESQATSQSPYDPGSIEAKWQQRWEADGLHHADRDPGRDKFYFLTMLPYPSGDLHIGHWYVMTPSDARARYLRMRGYNVMLPIGFDAFGLPAENAAIERNIHPKEWTYANITNMRRQLRTMGAMWDWRREATSADPAYYRWSQWFFLKLLEKGLAYRKLSAVDFCPKDNTTLAREQVVGEERLCERCGTPVIKRDLEQWFFRSTEYADELLQFDSIDWPDTIRHAQTNWIGRSEGAHVTFRTEAGEPLEVFTTRPDTLWGATFMVLAPEHPLVPSLTTDERRAEVDSYVEAARRETDIERLAVGREKTGVFTGGYAINPVNDERIPVWIADYVLLSYGTGAIMAVPAHDERDHAFATQFGLEIRPVIGDGDAVPAELPTMAAGPMINSGPLTGTPADEAIPATIAWLAERGSGERAINYRLHDWLVSRQRYWGCPIPIVYCKSCGVVPVPEDQLPVELPDDIEWRPTGESPLKFHPTWRHTTCPNCDEPAERETDTLDTFICSSWYHLRYLSPAFEDGAFDEEEYRYWMPVDTYTGGAEHATMHLIYARFFHKAARDMGVVSGDEPMLQLRNQGQILGPDGHRMSKSRGNVIDPDEQVAAYGADTVRAYLMFGYRWAEGGPWSSENIHGVVRWLHRVWDLVHRTAADAVAGAGGPDAVRELQRATHKAIRSVTADLERFEFNTVVSALMRLTNALLEAERGCAADPAFAESVATLLKLMAPVTPHITEELWAAMGQPYSVHQQAWPDHDEELAADDVVTLVVQVNGKVRGKVEVPADIDEAGATASARGIDNVQRAIGDGTPRRVIYVPGRLLNFVP